METKTNSIEIKNYCSITMSEEEAKIFYWMKQYNYIFKKAFEELRPGKLILHFNDLGKIKKHEFHFYPK